MFKVNFDSEQFARIEAKFKKDIKDILAQPAVMSEIGEFMVERVKFQARVEKPINEDGAFPLLKESTIRNREYLAKYNSTHETYESGRANVTLTGKFLDSLTYVVKGAGLVQILFQGTHPGYKTKSGRTKSVENADLVKWLAEKGFSVWDRSIKDSRMLKSRIKSIALRYVRRGLQVRSKLD